MYVPKITASNIDLRSVQKVIKEMIVRLSAKMETETKLFDTFMDQICKDKTEIKPLQSVDNIEKNEFK